MWKFLTYLKYKKQPLPEVPTIKYMFSLGFLLALYAVFALVASSEKSRVIITIPTDAVSIQDIFSVDIYAEVFEPVNAIRMELVFSGSADVEVFSIDRGQSVLTLWTRDPYVENNTIYLEGGTYRRGFVGKHKIGTIKFRAKSDGRLILQPKSLVLLAGDGTGRSLSLGISPTANMYIGTSADEKPVRIDINNTITLREVSIFMADWRSGSPEFDFNNDGKVNFVDFSILLTRFFKS